MRKLNICVSLRQLPLLAIPIPSFRSDWRDVRMCKRLVPSDVGHHTNAQCADFTDRRLYGRRSRFLVLVVFRWFLWAGTWKTHSAGQGSAHMRLKDASGIGVARTATADVGMQCRRAPNVGELFRVLLTRITLRSFVSRRKGSVSGALLLVLPQQGPPPAAYNSRLRLHRPIRTTNLLRVLI